MRFFVSRRSPLVTVCVFAFVISAIVPASVWQQQPKTQSPQPPQPPAQKQEQKDKSKRDTRQGAVVEEALPADGQDRISVDTELVQLDVKVVDQNNQPVYDLGRDNFSVFEDKIKQEIDKVSREEVPISLGIVIDTSGSMRTKLQTVTDAALSLIKQMRNDDETFIAQFKDGDQIDLVQDFTRDKRELEDGMNELYTGGGTALLDAIIATADYSHEKGRQRRKALIVISDGLDKNSSLKEKQVIEALQEVEVQVYMVGFVDEDEEKSIFGKSPSKKAKELLTRLADDSGGRAFFPRDISEMPAVTEQIAKDLRTQYVISYYPTNSLKDGKFRSVRVVVDTRDKRKLIARTRQGYYPKKEGQSTQTSGAQKPVAKNP